MKRDNFYLIAVILLGIGILCVITSAVLEALFNDNGIFEQVEIACSIGACIFAFAGIILACARNNKSKEVNSDESRK